MKKVAVVLMLFAVVACKFDTGSNGYTKSIGQSISLECFKANLNSVAGLELEEETASSMVLIAPGIRITIEFEYADSVVNSYTIVTKTEESKNGGIHNAVASAISQSCSA